MTTDDAHQSSERSTRMSHPFGMLGKLHFLFLGSTGAVSTSVIGSMVVEDKHLPRAKGWDALLAYTHTNRRPEPHSARRISSQPRLRDGFYGRLHTRSGSTNTIAAPETRRSTSALHP
jgi:hypothetical protein